MRRIILLTGLVCLAKAAEPTFDTATIALNRSHSNIYHVGLDAKPGGATLTIRNAPLRMCVQLAYEVLDYQVAGPGWTDKARYDIEAKLSENPSMPHAWAALRTLLADRLKLSVRREQKEMPVYVLSVAEGGPKLRPATEERAAAAPFGERLGSTMSIDRGTTASFCRDLSRRLNRIVVDETGIQGEFAFHLQFGNSRNVVGPTVFKAVERQLGLKLTESKRPVEGVMIESALKSPEPR
ncbi:MAG TPA: TIGR03435 family protein [Candidatus Solibacter sp.]|nr:TIGR03435 family protein [Candidatus Solibacter sp.]